MTLEVARGGNGTGMNKPNEESVAPEPAEPSEAYDIGGGRRGRGREHGGGPDEGPSARAAGGPETEAGRSPAEEVVQESGQGPDDGDFTDEFRPEPVRQRPSAGQEGQAEGPQVEPE
ncbi:hypothetical protein [Actinomadura macrotermitis]|uniref:Uncharacterized protein n=1 Tax=Actinomadura macrotermitis TaxID=2585200 RepID=A0A7K0C6I6_9ACTN|nr:hypothetical protein [Actinomadura macrotermitis]MQY09053.1 hypothetical protein [Actinomadura macrotermitis]